MLKELRVCIAPSQPQNTLMHPVHGTTLRRTSILGIDSDFPNSQASSLLSHKMTPDHPQSKPADSADDGWTWDSISELEKEVVLGLGGG
jgi:hypothetical protein